MKIRINLHGALREADPAGHIELDVPGDSTVATLRQRLMDHLRAHPAGIAADLVQRSAFASDEEILHDNRELPASGVLSVLPPVSGG